MGGKPKTDRATKVAKLGESPVTLRLGADIVGRLDALLEKVAADSDTATLLGGVSRSSVVRLALLEGVRVLERRYGKRNRRAS